MKVSTKGRYSVRLLLDLAEHAGKGYVPLKDIAERQEISKKYLEQIVALLNVSGMLRTNRGYQGGYMLAKAPKEYTLGYILRITEGGLLPVACLENEPNQCPRSSRCKALNVWEGLNRVVSQYLDGITLQDLLDEPQAAEDDIALAADGGEGSGVRLPDIGNPDTEPAAPPPEPEMSVQEAPAPAAEKEAHQKSERWFWNSF